MRHLLAAGTVIAASLGAMLLAPAGLANEDPDPKGSQQAEKAAAKAFKPLLKSYTKQVRGDAAAKSKVIKTLTKAAKSGRNIENESGVSSTPGVKVSLDQARGLASRMRDTVAEFHENAVSGLRDTYRNALDDPLIAGFSNTSSARSLPGTGGPFDVARDSCSRAWESGNEKLKKAIAKFQQTLSGLGYTFTYVDCVPPKLNSPGFGVPPGSVLPAHSFLVSIADSDGGVYAVVAPADGGATTGRNAQCVLVGSDGIGESFGTVDDDALSILFERSDGTGDSRFPRLDRREWTYLSLANAQPQGTGDLFIERLGVPVHAPPLCDDPREASLRTTFTRIGGRELRSTEVLYLVAGGRAINSNPSVPEREVESVVDQLARTAGIVLQGGSKIARLDAALFPCGQGPNGFTVCPTIPASDPGGRLIVVAVGFATDIPLDDRVNSYQYGFVFDQDGDPSNDYVPIPQFANDYFRGSDKWYAVEYTPSGGWELKVTDARNNAFTPVASAARAVILGNSILLAVPESEFSVANPAYRTTSFRHSGDFGQSSPFDYSADYDPPPGEPLRPFDGE